MKKKARKIGEAKHVEAFVVEQYRSSHSNNYQRAAGKQCKNHTFDEMSRQVI